jgi:hypothetical protein
MRAGALNYLLYQTGWCALVLGAAGERPAAGAAIAVALMAVHLGLSDRRRPESILLAIVGVVGFVVETTHLGLGLYRPADWSRAGVGGPAWPPLWLILLWPQFATTLRYCLRWLVRRPLVAAAAGAVGGPLAFAAGARLGAVEMGRPLGWSVAVLSLSWALVLPFVGWIARRVAPAAGGYRLLRGGQGTKALVRWT